MNARALVDALCEGRPDATGYHPNDSYWQPFHFEEPEPDQARAEHYFSIGQDEEEGLGKCWVFDGVSLKVAKGGSHAKNFGYGYAENKFKGWYDVNNGRVSVVFPDTGKHTVDEVPQQLHSLLQRKFKPTAWYVF